MEREYGRIPGKGWSKKDRRGIRYGSLVALSEMKERYSNGNVQWMCVCDCGKTTVVPSGALQNGNTRSCGCLYKGNKNRPRLFGEQNPNWKGGRHYHDGYVRVPHNGTGTGEHRVVMIKHLGRELLPEESVHHKNGVRDDNRFENLELWSTSQPYGQRVEDKINWAYNVLEQYGELI